MKTTHQIVLVALAAVTIAGCSPAKPAANQPQAQPSSTATIATSVPCLPTKADMGGGTFAATPAWTLNFCDPADLAAFHNEVGAGGWGNNELQNYTDGRNVSVVGGHLVLEARADYTSARLRSNLAFSPQYGKIVWAGVTMPPMNAIGAWPALWLWPLGQKYQVGKQISASKNGDKDLANGEIDTAEYVPADGDGNVNCSAHSYLNHPDKAGEPEGSGHERSGAVPGLNLTQPNDFWLEWTPNYLRSGVNNYTCQTVARENAGPANWPYDQPFTIVMNVAIGGDWGGEKGVIAATMPWQMSIDAIVYYPYVS